MIVKRTQEFDTDTFEVGDRINFSCDGKEYTATNLMKIGNKSLFILDQIFDNNIYMDLNNDKDINWENSELRKIANIQILSSFPNEIKAIITPLKNGDYLFPPAREHIIGAIPLKYFLSKNNRISSRKDKPGCYWLRDSKETGCFYYINKDGNEDSTFANCQSIGFRPMFWLNDPKTISIDNSYNNTENELSEMDILTPEYEWDILTDNNPLQNTFSDDITDITIEYNSNPIPEQEIPYVNNTIPTQDAIRNEIEEKLAKLTFG